MEYLSCCRPPMRWSTSSPASSRIDPTPKSFSPPSPRCLESRLHCLVIPMLHVPPSPEPDWLVDAAAVLDADGPVAAAFAKWSRAAADRRRLRPPSASMPTSRARSMEPGPGRSGGVCHAALPLQSLSDPLAAALARWSVEAADRRRFRTVVRSFRSSRHTREQTLSPTDRGLPRSGRVDKFVNSVSNASVKTLREISQMERGAALRTDAVSVSSTSSPSVPTV